MRNFIKYMACNIDKKKKRKKEEDDILDRFQIGLVKKTLCDKLGKKHVKELENRTLCMTNLGKSTQRT